MFNKICFHWNIHKPSIINIVLLLETGTSVAGGSGNNVAEDRQDESDSISFSFEDLF